MKRDTRIDPYMEPKDVLALNLKHLSDFNLGEVSMICRRHLSDFDNLDSFQTERQKARAKEWRKARDAIIAEELLRYKARYESAIIDSLEPGV